MPTKREREYYAMGYRDGYEAKSQERRRTSRVRSERLGIPVTSKDPYLSALGYEGEGGLYRVPKKKRKLSAWNKYVKANSKKPRFRYRNGKLNLKKMAIAFRKTPAGKKKRR